MNGLPAKISPQGYVVIHGHFYQPPRENPWIERSKWSPAPPPTTTGMPGSPPSATPQRRGPGLDGQGRILDIVNNYQHLSFNFGPTLIAWLKEQAPNTYPGSWRPMPRVWRPWGRQRLAQVYNHIIMPLAIPAYCQTQIRWGIKDFEHRFRRSGEGMWLPETAVNYPTLASLVDHGMKFVILSPYQAKRVRPLAGGELAPAPHALDTSQAYRCFLPGRRRRPEAAPHRRLFL